jgi:DNA-binding CsgD family transcriptional regulator
MEKYRGIEFHTSPEGEVHFKNEGAFCELKSDEHADFIQYMESRIAADYPKAYTLLNETYQKSEKNKRYFSFLKVRRFIKCNFANFDTQNADIDNEGNFHFEQVQCPLRGECQGFNIICNPEFNTNLSEREIEILKLYCLPMEMAQIADELYISKATIETHVRNIRRKLDLSSKAELMKYVQINL